MQTSPPQQTAMLAAVGLSLALVALSACSPKPSDTAQSASATPTLVTLTAAQLQHIRLYTVDQSAFHKSVEVSGVVDFDNVQATSVLSPISGPVSRLLVQPGQAV